MTDTTYERHSHAHSDMEVGERPAKIVAGGSTAEAIAGIGAVVLSILGIVRVLPYAMAGIASIVAGGALLLEGAAVAARFKRLVPDVKSREAAELGGGTSAETLGGAGAITLGILALAGVLPEVLLPVSAIVLGGAMLIGSAQTARLNSLDVMGHHYTEDRSVEAASYSVQAAAGAEVLVGLGAIVLGILGLIGFSPVILSLVSFLSVGGALFLAGGAIGAKMLTLIKH